LRLSRFRHLTCGAGNLLLPLRARIDPRQSKALSNARVRRALGDDRRHMTGSGQSYSFISSRSCTLMNVGARVCDVSRTGMPWMSGPSTLLPVR
jgi:hypothetical protein